VFEEIKKRSLAKSSLFAVRIKELVGTSIGATFVKSNLKILSSSSWFRNILLTSSLGFLKYFLLSLK